ncbi:hypothetical protein RRU01S_15_01120 [Agrobacterium rubi TR3 = NBRC 13261]|uniref:Uncharacterized protein n=1 Tax=Agrobacterium rubi TR3 = NBRC 13261 TaxID=1368415 RepID=A0A081CWZ1_9HYPH|nr:hypothetical protein [Agrobacterium rubi]MBP1878154.1 hypothetical protein [Agrobacterium rubi]GAK71187.1 hypothetical protein RRU01S_15_01120 [Agrobacterium rubi TR3 = NBRC 13261]
MSIIRVLVWAFALIASWSPSHAETESFYQDRFCAGMTKERVLPNGTRVDCLTDVFAIEVDWTHKWAEAIGQSLLYAAATGKQPEIILVCKVRQEACLKHSYLIEEATAHWKLPIKVWLCLPDDLTLSECRGQSG